MNFQEQNQKLQIKKSLKEDTIKSINAIYEGKEMVLTAFGSVIFPLHPTEVTGHSGILALVAKVSPFDSQNSNS